MYKWLFIMLLLFSVASAYNHPEIKWKSVSTEHFVINFYDATEPSLYAAWKIAEEAYSVLSKLYKFQMREKISISLADYDDYSNGWADWTASNIMIWVPDARFDLRSNTTWLSNVIVHELTHIISLHRNKNMQMMDITVGLSLTTNDESYSIQEPFARISTTPNWLSEGIAQYESEVLGNDCWDSRREMVLRCATLENRLLSLDEMGYFNHDSPGKEMVYNQGFSFCKHIARKMGEEELQKIFREGSAGVVNISSLISKNTGIPLPVIYKDWTDSLRDYFSGRIPSEPTFDRTIWDKGKYNFSPEISSDGKYEAWFTSHKDDGDRTDLIVVEYGKPGLVNRIKYAHTALCFSPESDILYYIKSRSPNEHGSNLNDIYSFDLKNGRHKRVTTDARVYDMAVMPGGKGILCVRYQNSLFTVERLNISSGKFSIVSKGTPGEPFMNLCLDPADSTTAVVSRIVKGKSCIFRLSLKTGVLEMLSPGTAQEETPFWSSDGRIYFSADYDGIFNIYSVNSDGSDLKRHTYCIGGYFSPQIGPDGVMISSKYGASGFSIVQITQVSEPYDTPEQYRCFFNSLPVPKGMVTIRARSYEYLRLKGIWELQVFADFYKNNSILTGQYNYDEDYNKYQLGARLIKSQSDALQKKNRVLAIGMGYMGANVKPNSGTSSQLKNENRLLDREPVLRYTRTLKENLRARVSSVMNLNPYLERFSITKLNSSAQAGTSDQDSTTGSQSMAYPVVFPAMAWESRSGLATTGLVLDVQMPMFIPSYFSGLIYSQWQLARDLYAGVDVHVIARLLAESENSAPEMHIISEFPIKLNWTRTGYYNEDISYNYGGMTSLQFMAGPSFMPAYSIDSEGDTTMVVPSGLAAGLDFIHAFPLWKYGAFQIFNYATVNYVNMKVLDEAGNIGGLSRTYIRSQTGARIVFPLARNINRAGVYYWDALYGNIGYVFTMKMNGEFFNSLRYYGTDLISDPDYTSNASVGQFITAGLELGHYKSYLFFKKLSLDFDYEILRSLFHISVSAGF